MANRYVRSAFWLCACSGLGYTLLVLTSQSDTNIEQLRKELPGAEKIPSEAYKKSQQFVNVLQSATENSKPFYRLSKEEIDKELKKP